MIDLHTHLDLYPNALKIIDRVNKENLFTLAVTTSPRAWLATSQVFQEYKNIKVALGMHPEIVDQKFDEVELLMSLIQKASFIGEVGLDGLSKNMRSLEKQRLIFEKIIRKCESVGGRIISIHSRNMVSEIISILKKYPHYGIPILHWFSGSFSELEEAIKLKCYFSVNSAILNSKKGRELVSKIPLELLLPESDGPFITLRNKPVMPWETIDVCHSLKNIFGLEIDNFKVIFLENLNKILNAMGHDNVSA